MKKSKKWIIIVIVLVLLGAGAYWFLAGKKGGEEKRSVRTEPVSRMDLESTVVLKGTVSGTDFASVYSKSSQRIVSIAVKEGDYVNEGQVLCELERDENYEINLEKMELEYSEAKRNLENKQALYDSGAVSAEEVLQAKNSLRLIELNLEELKKEASAAVTSPIAGTVTRVNTAVGKLAGGNNAEALFQIENIEKLEMRVAVSEYEIADVEVGQDVRVTSEAIGKTKLHGRVESIAPTGELKSQGSSEMVIPVVISVDKGDSSLFAGVTAKAEIITGSVANALVVPVDSLMENTEDGEISIYLVKEGKLKKTPVSLLLEGDFYAALQEDGSVAEGDPVVTGPEATLEDGMEVSTGETADGSSN